MTITAKTPWGRGLAIITVGAASIVLAGCSLLGGGGGNDTAPTGEGETTDVFSIKVGDCINDEGLTGAVNEVPVIDCAEPHDSEAYESVIMPDGDYPGEEATTTQADADCVSAFETFAGISYDESALDFTYFYPSTETWAQGDREVLCLIYDPAGEVTGTLAGAAR